MYSISVCATALLPPIAGIDMFKLNILLIFATIAPQRGD